MDSRSSSIGGIYTLAGSLWSYLGISYTKETLFYNFKSLSFLTNLLYSSPLEAF